MFKTRLLSDGSVDQSFDAPGWENSVRAIALEADGSILVGGDFSGGDWDGHIARLSKDGALNFTLRSGGTGYGPDGTARKIVIQPDNYILIGGDFTHVGGLGYQYVARLWTNGATDGGFGSYGFSGVDRPAYDLKVLSDGKILVASSGVTLLTTNGSISKVSESPTGSDGTPQQVKAVSLDTRGPAGIVAAGQFDYTTGTSRHGLARFTFGSSSLPLDGTWADCGAFSSWSGNSVNAFVFDVSGNLIIGGDFSSIEGTTRHGIANVVLGN